MNLGIEELASMVSSLRTVERDVLKAKPQWKLTSLTSEEEATLAKSKEINRNAMSVYTDVRSRVECHMQYLITTRPDSVGLRNMYKIMCDSLKPIKKTIDDMTGYTDIMIDLISSIKDSKSGTDIEPSF